MIHKCVKTRINMIQQMTHSILLFPSLNLYRISTSRNSNKQRNPIPLLQPPHAASNNLSNLCLLQIHGKAKSYYTKDVPPATKVTKGSENYGWKKCWNRAIARDKVVVFLLTLWPSSPIRILCLCAWMCTWENGTRDF